MSMIKCPNCGSTAQPKKINCTDTKKCLIERFQCSCGCCFDVFYYWCGNVIYMTDVKIVDKNQTYDIINVTKGENLLKKGTDKND